MIATAGEILAEEDDGNFVRDSITDDSRVRTAISWLEEATLLTREENRVQVFPSSLRVGSMDAAGEKLAKAPMTAEYRNQLLAIIQALISADADEGISTDELMAESGLSADKVRAALYDMERLGIASNDTVLTAFVHSAVERSSRKRFEAAASLEATLIEQLRETAPDLDKGDTTLLHLRRAAHDLKEAGHLDALPERIARIVRSLSMDGRDADSAIGSVRLRRLDPETMEVKLQRNWDDLAKIVHRAIGALSPGDSLMLRKSTEPWTLVDSKGVGVGRLAHAFSPPRDMNCVKARVFAICEPPSKICKAARGSYAELTP